jgi:hypothetical protein
MGLMADVNARTEITKSETTERSSGSPENEGLTLLRRHSWIVCAAGDDKYRLLTFVPPCGFTAPPLRSRLMLDFCLI